jgi:hypothetical protein
MTYTKDNLRQIFQQPYNLQEWQTMLHNYFHAKDLKVDPERIEGIADDEQGYYLGVLNTTDSYRIGLFYYQIQHGNVARKRVGLRNLVKSFVNPNWGEFDAALVVFDSGMLWRLSFVCDIKGENTAAKRYTYVFGETDNYYNTPVGRFDALQRNGISFENIKDAFSVERLNKDFFNGYKERYVKFLNFLNNDTKDNRDYVKKLLGRLVFLQFLQKKGWMGVPANNQGWTGGDKFYLNNLIGSYEGNDRLLSDVLEPLFFNTLNERRDNDLADPRLGENIKIPYLNGGLFDKDDLDKKDIDFPYDYFKELMGFFAMYNFTIDENDPEDSEIGIDPEMLGHIFENLLEDNKDKGAFYTPKEIVQYMSKESVSQYLKSYTPEELHTAIDSLIKQRVVEPILQKKENARLVNSALTKVKVCDPAIGSGAFPMGVLNVLFDCRHLLYGFIGVNEVFSYAKVKRDIIQNNIYGVDIEKGAVDIARLRFWLALVVDENEPQPLPNLDYKIMCGDSLLHRFALDAPFQNVLKDYNQKNGTQYTLDDYRQWVYDYTNISDHTQKDDFRQRIEDIKRAVKTKLSKEEMGKIAKVRGAIDNLQMGDFFGNKKKENEKKIRALQKELKALEQQREEIESNKIYDQAFEWRFEFPALLDENGDFMGFDIVIGNPPYVLVQTFNNSALENLYKNKYEVASYKIDLYHLFLEAGYNLLCNNGVLSFINPTTFLTNNYTQPLRDLLLYRTIILSIINIGDNVFDASVNTGIEIIKKGLKEDNTLNYYYAEYENDKLSVKMISSVQQRDYLKAEKHIIQPITSNESYYLSHKIENKAELLKEYASVNFGMQLRNRKIFTNDVLVSPSPEVLTAYHRKCLTGKDILDYVVFWNNRYCYFNEEARCGGCWIESLHNSKNKILVRQVGTVPACGIDKEGLAVLNSAFMIVCKRINPFGTLGILNSKLIKFYWQLKFEDKRKTFPKIKGTYLELLPIIPPTDEITRLVENIVYLKEESLSNDTSALEQQIDLLVYHLYGLTYDEVLIVDPDTPITRDEYEDNS